MSRHALRSLVTPGAAVVTIMACILVAGCGSGGDSATSGTSTPGSAPVRAIGGDTEVTFVADGITVHGSLRLPTSRSGNAVPAALILAGSGPTDRNGNSAIPGAPRTDNLGQIADTLAARGIASLRYDKFGSGATGVGGMTRAQIAQQGFGVYVDEAVAGAQFLAQSKGVDRSRLALVGHSEGALIALAAARSGRITPPAGLALLEPAPLPILDILSIQLTQNFAAAVAKSQLTQSESDALTADLARTVASIRGTGTVPADLPTTLTNLGLNALNARALRDEDRLDPRTLAAGLPTGLHVLTTCSDADTQVTCDEVAGVNRAAAHTALDAVHLTTATHPLQSASTTTLTPEFVSALNTWTTSALRP